MIPPEPGDQNLIVHLFAPLTGPHLQQGQAQLRQVWDAYAARLELSEAIESSGVPADPPLSPGAGGDGGAPAHSPTGQSVVVAVRRHGAAPGREAMWVHDHDVACVSLRLAATGPALTWSDLHDEWERAAGGISYQAMLGVAEVRTGLASEGSPDGQPDRLDGGVFNEHASVATTQGGLAVRSLPGLEADGVRSLVVLAPPQLDDTLGAFVWTPTGPVLAPLTRYLMHTAKLQYEIRIWHRDRGVHALRADADRTIGQLRALLKDGAAGLSARELQQAEERILRLQADEAGLVDAAAQVRAMRRTVQIATANMTAYRRRFLGADPTVEDGDDLFSQDQALGVWFGQQLDDDATYLDTARERAQHLGALASRELRRRQADDREAAQRRQERFALWQTAVIGAVVMCLTTVQSLQYTIPLPGRVRPAVIAVLGAASLLVSLHLVHLAASEAGTQRQARTCWGWGRWSYPIAIGLFAGATAWLLIAWPVTTFGGHPVSATVTQIAALASFLGATGAAAVSWSRSRAGHHAPGGAAPTRARSRDVS